ncbi:hypothetical protein LINPERHAP1_LOCUS23213 [Linum perenne]
MKDRIGSLISIFTVTAASVHLPISRPVRDGGLLPFLAEETGNDSGPVCRISRYHELRGTSLLSECCSSTSSYYSSGRVRQGKNETEAWQMNDRTTGSLKLGFLCKLHC